MKASIALLPGDGIGAEVAREAAKVLQAVARRFGHTFTLTEGLVGGAAIDATGAPLPGATLDLCRASDAALLAAVGGPKWDDPTAKVRPEQGLLTLRKELELFANLRPVKVQRALRDATTLKPDVVDGVDLLVVRELTGGIYFGARKEATPKDENAWDTMAYSREEVDRVVRLAAEAARGRGGRLTSVDKANVLACSRLWRRVATEVIAADYPDVELEHVLVDSMTMHLIRRPSTFDVVVTGNMFGDIITDEASMLAGSLGLLPSASLGTATNAHGHPWGLYEPVHGSAPEIAGQDIANPLAAILSAAMLLRHSLGLEDEARAIEERVDAVLDAGLRTADLAETGATVIGTSAMGDAIAELDAIAKL